MSCIPNLCLEINWQELRPVIIFPSIFVFVPEMQYNMLFVCERAGRAFFSPRERSLVTFLDFPMKDCFIPNIGWEKEWREGEAVRRGFLKAR